MAPLKFINGYLQVTSIAGGPEFQLIANTALLTNNARPGDPGNCAPQKGPGLIGARSLGGSGLGAGFGEYSGSTYQKLWYEGTLNLTGNTR